jgi:SSS family solute:Na+ symporter
VSLLLLFLLAYAALMVVVGVWAGRRVRTGGDFFVAGRDLPAGLIFATFLASNIGAGATISATALAYREGLSAWWWNGSAGLGSLVLAFWIGPRIWREARDRGYLTAGDFLDARYGHGVTRLVAALIWLGTLSILAAQLLGAATVLGVAGGMSRTAGVFIAAAVTTAYFAAGGLLSAAWVNGLQVVVILAGFLIALPPAVGEIGGLSALVGGGTPHADFLYSSGAGSGWALLAMLGPAFIVSPGLLQKAYGARDERAVRLGIGANALVLLLLAFVPVVFGLAARATLPGLTHPDDALPAILLAASSPAVSALALAAIFSAAVSSADAVLFMLATSAARDLYRGWFRPSSTDAQMLRVARGAALLGGVAGIALAFRYQSVQAALSTFYALLTVTLFVPVLGGLLSRRAGRPEAYAAIVVGVGTLFAAQALTGGRGPGMWTPTLCALSGAALAFLAVLLGRRAAGPR